MLAPIALCQIRKQEPGQYAKKVCARSSDYKIEITSNLLKLLLLLARHPRHALVMNADFIHKPLPSFLLRRSGGLLNRARQVGEFPLDLVARQELQPADQDGGFHHCGLGAIEPLERRM